MQRHSNVTILPSVNPLLIDKIKLLRISYSGIVLHFKWIMRARTRASVCAYLWFDPFHFGSVTLTCMQNIYLNSLTGDELKKTSKKKPHFIDLFSFIREKK